MSVKNRVTEWKTEENNTQALQATVISIVWFKWEKLILDGQEVVDTIYNTEEIVQKIIGMNWEDITMDRKPVVNTIH
jgi:hypothetical protein